MGNESQQIILDTDDRAATLETVTGWVSRNGRFYGNDERLARYDGCTHRACSKCKNPVEKNWLICEQCREEAAEEKWRNYPERQWDGARPIYSESTDEYFFDMENLISFCEEEETDLPALRLVHCQPIFPPTLNEDWFADALPEDGEVPDELWAAAEAFNAVMKSAEPLSYEPCNIRVSFSPAPANQEP